MGNSSTCCKDNKSKAQGTQQFQIAQIESLPVIPNPINGQFKSPKSFLPPWLLEIVQQSSKIVSIQTYLFKSSLNFRSQIFTSQELRAILVNSINQQKLPTGFGFLAKQNCIYYLGYFLNGKASGLGFYFFDSTSYYFGRIVDSKAQDDHGFFKNHQIEYSGGFSDNQFHGLGQETGNLYCFNGYFQQGLRKQGQLKWTEEDYEIAYQGSFDNKGRFNGKGICRNMKENLMSHLAFTKVSLEQARSRAMESTDLNLAQDIRVTIETTKNRGEARLLTKMARQLSQVSFDKGCRLEKVIQLTYKEIKAIINGFQKLYDFLLVCHLSIIYDFTLISLSKMIFCQMTVNSPNNKERTALALSNHKQVLHVTAKQLLNARILNDDVVYNKLVMSKIIILGQLVSSQTETTPKGMTVLNITLKDSTGLCSIKMYQNQYITSINSQLGAYVKVAASIKCGGLVYRPEIKTIGTAIKIIEDFNEVTEHFLQSMKTAIMAEL